MNCADFSRWLDEGMRAADARAADLHAGDCLSCARQLDATRSLDRILADLPTTRPYSFVDEVMKKVSVEPARPISLWEYSFDAKLPWWIRFLAEPAPVLSFVLSSALIAWSDRFWARVPAAVSSLARTIDLSPAVSLLRDWLPAHPASAAVVGLAAMAAMTALSFVLYKGAQRIASA